MKRIPFILLLVVCAASASSRAGTLQTIQQRGELRWGGDIQGGEPYVFEDPKNPSHLIGFEVEIVDELTKRLGVKSAFQQNSWSNLVPALERGDFDVAINGLEATSERADRVLMSDPYFVYAEVLAVRKGSPYKTLNDLRGKRVATLNQTYAHDLLRERGFEPVLYEGVQEPYLDLANGKVDGVLLESIIADRYGCPIDGVSCLPEEVARGVYVILMRKDDHELKAAVDGALYAMKKDGTTENILKRWHLWDKRQTEPLPPIANVNRSRSLTWPQFLLFLKGAVVTLQLSFTAFLIAVPFGFFLGISRLYGGKFLRFISAFYIELFRGTPVLLQLYVLYFGIAPYIKLGPIEACVLGLGLNYAAYEAEIYRASIRSIARGQTEASISLGLGFWQTLRHVIMPQAFRVALPPMTNDFIALLKDSSLVGVLAVIELTKRMTITAVDMRGWLVPGALCAALYFAMSFPLARLARHMEKKLHHDLNPRIV